LRGLHSRLRVETPVKVSQPSTDRIRAWLRGSLRNHSAAGYQVDITENELLQKIRTTTNCRYCGCLLRYFRLKGISLDLWAEVDRQDRNQITLTSESVQIICHVTL
jgi:hypothetical protein